MVWNHTNFIERDRPERLWNDWHMALATIFYKQDVATYFWKYLKMEYIYEICPWPARCRCVGPERSDGRIFCERLALHNPLRRKCSPPASPAPAAHRLDRRVRSTLFPQPQLHLRRVHPTPLKSGGASSCCPQSPSQNWAAAAAAVGVTLWSRCTSQEPAPSSTQVKCGSQKSSSSMLLLLFPDYFSFLWFARKFFHRNKNI
jgi:hypothetical protein